MAEFYDLDGEAVSYEKWAEIFAGNDRFLVGDRIPERGVKVSTVWIGLAWALEIEDGERPLIFETMAFEDRDDAWDDLGCWRWASREEALNGHAKIVDDIRSGALVLDQLNDD
jgi:hypothetical protein